jgi:hypothetical protein
MADHAASANIRGVGRYTMLDFTGLYCILVGVSRLTSVWAG